MDVFSEALNAHVVSKDDDAADGEDVLSVELPNDGSERSINESSEAAGGVDVGLHFHPLVMVGGDEGGCIDIEGTHWWSSDGHELRRKVLLVITWQRVVCMMRIRADG